MKKVKNIFRQVIQITPYRMKKRCSTYKSRLTFTSLIKRRNNKILEKFTFGSGKVLKN